MSRKAQSRARLFSLRGGYFNNRYTMIRLLGQGASSKVFLCIDQQNDRNVALKFTLVRENWKRELRAYVQISSDKAHVMKILDSFQIGPAFVTAMQYYPTTIYDFTEEDAYSLSHTQIRVIATQLLSAVKCIHELGITHTDIKTENLFLVDARTKLFKLEDGTFTRRLVDPGIVLGDLDQAVILAKTGWDTQGILCQTACYRAPEVVLGLEWDTKVDEYSCGVLIAELLIGDMPFQPVEEDTDCPTADERAEHLRQINFQLGPTPRRMFLASPNPKLKQLYKDQFNECKMIDDLPTDWKNIIGRKLYNHLAILATQLMTPDPDFRPTAEEALRMPVLEQQGYEECKNNEGVLVENSTEDWPVLQKCANKEEFYLNIDAYDDEDVSEDPEDDDTKEPRKKAKSEILRGSETAKVAMPTKTVKTREKDIDCSPPKKKAKKHSAGRTRQVRSTSQVAEDMEPTEENHDTQHNYDLSDAATASHSVPPSTGPTVAVVSLISVEKRLSTMLLGHEHVKKDSVTKQSLKGQPKRVDVNLRGNSDGSHSNTASFPSPPALTLAVSSQFLPVVRLNEAILRGHQQKPPTTQLLAAGVPDVTRGSAISVLSPPAAAAPPVPGPSSRAGIDQVSKSHNSPPGSSGVTGAISKASSSTLRAPSLAVVAPFDHVSRSLVVPVLKQPVEGVPRPVFPESAPPERLTRDSSPVTNFIPGALITCIKQEEEDPDIVILPTPLSNVNQIGQLALDEIRLEREIEDSKLQLSEIDKEVQNIEIRMSAAVFSRAGESEGYDDQLLRGIAELSIDYCGKRRDQEDIRVEQEKLTADLYRVKAQKNDLLNPTG